MHVGLEALDQFVREQLARDQAGGLVGGLEPGARQRLVPAVTEQRLVARLFVLGELVRPRFVRLDRAGRGHVAVEPHARDAGWRARIITSPRHEPRDLVFLAAVGIVPAAERQFVRVAVDPHVVAVGNAEALAILRADVDVHLAGTGAALVAPVHVAERTEQRRHVIRIDRHGVRAVPVLGGVEDVTVTAVGQRVLGAQQRLDAVAAVAHLPAHVRTVAGGDLPVGRALLTDGRVRCGRDRARIVKSGVRRFAVHHQVLAGLDELGFRPVELQAPGLRVPRLRLLHLLVGVDARIGAGVHERRDALFRQFLELFEAIALERCRTVDNTLQVHLRTIVGDELPHLLETPVAGQAREFARHPEIGVVVGDGIKGAIDRRARVDLHERIGVGGGHVRVLELHPRIDAVNDVRVFARGRPPPFVVHHQLAARQRVVDDVEVALLVAERGVRVDLPDRLGRCRHVGAGGDRLVAGLHDALAVGPVVHRLVADVGLDRDRTIGVELQLERVFHGEATDAGKQRQLVVAGVGADIAAVPAERAGQRRYQEDGAVLVVVVEELVRPHAAGEEGPSTTRRYGACQTDRGRFRRPGQLLDLRRGHVLVQILASQVEHRSALDAAAVGKLDLEAAVERGFHPGLVEMGAKLVARHGHRFAGRFVPHDKVGQIAGQLVIHIRAVLIHRGRCLFTLRQHVRPVGERGVLVAGKHVAGLETIERIHAHQGRQVGEALDKIRVVPFLAHQYLRHPQRKGRIGARADDNHVVALGGGGRILDRDRHRARALEPRLGQPVRVGHLGGDPVHAPGNDELGILGVEQLEIVGLFTGHHRVSRRQIGVKRIGVPGARRHGLIGPDLADVRIEQRHRIAHAEGADDAQRALLGHATAELHDARAGAAGGGDHVRVVALRLQITPALLARIGAGDVDEAVGVIAVGVFMRHAHPRVPAAAHEVARRGAGDRVARKTAIDPLLETAADKGTVNAAVAVEAARQHQALLAAAWVPAVRGAVPVKIGGLAISVRGFDAHHDVVLDVRVEQTVVGVVRAAEKDEFRIGAEHIAVDTFPVAARVILQGVIDPDRRQVAELRHQHPGGGGRETGGPGHLQKTPPCSRKAAVIRFGHAPLLLPLLSTRR